MSVTLRFQRHGTHNRPFYHLVATDSRSPRNSKFIEKLGLYDPKAEPSFVNFDQERLQYWYGKGATVSAVVGKLLHKNKIVLTRDTAKKTSKK